MGTHQHSLTMKVLIVLALAALACADKVRVKGVYEKADFEAYKAAFGKSYHPKEELMRHESTLTTSRKSTPTTCSTMLENQPIGRESTLSVTGPKKNWTEEMDSNQRH